MIRIRRRRAASLAAILLLAILFGPAHSARADYASAVLSDNPIAYYPLDETAGPTAANLGSLGAAANGTYTATVNQNAAGPPLQLGAGNTAIAVGPADGYVAASVSILSNLSAFSMSAFIRPAARTTTRIGLFGQNDAVEFGFISASTIQIWTPNGGSLDVNYPFVDDEWHHIATVGDGTSLHVYFDGVEAPQAGGNGGIVTGNYGSSGFFFNIGGGGVYDATGNQFTGVIDEVAVFNRALSQLEIQEHLAASLIPEPCSLILAVLAAVGVALIGRWQRRP